MYRVLPGKWVACMLSCMNASRKSMDRLLKKITLEAGDLFVTCWYSKISIIIPCGKDNKWNANLELTEPYAVTEKSINLSSIGHSPRNIGLILPSVPGSRPANLPRPQRIPSSQWQDRHNLNDVMHMEEEIWWSCLLSTSSLLLWHCSWSI